MFSFVFSTLIGFAPLARNSPPKQVQWSSAMLYCGAVLWLGQYSGLQQCSHQWCQRRCWSLLCMWSLDSGLP